MNDQMQVTMPVVDTLRFRVTAERLVKRTSIAVGVEIIALVSAQDRDVSALEARVREALARFIDARWHTASSERTRDDSGFERVKLIGYARVPREENVNLAERARIASSEGLAIQNPLVNYKVAAAVLVAETEKLHGDIIRQAQARIAEFDELTGRSWRIGNIQFGVFDRGEGEYSPKMARRESAHFGSDETDVLLTSERISMIAEVELRSLP
ncbi:MAG TPA: hypothetical protein VN581_11540 [Patescibacteria group bacterium]|nr:hypothetical protein [Patescibacteria group bacterium]